MQTCTCILAEASKYNYACSVNVLKTKNKKHNYARVDREVQLLKIEEIMHVLPHFWPVHVHMQLYYLQLLAQKLDNQRKLKQYCISVCMNQI